MLKKIFPFLEWFKNYNLRLWVDALAGRPWPWS